MTIRFAKMHGIGNDYVYVNGFEQAVDDPADLARAMADRHFGIGSDGLILVLPVEAGVEADVRMRMFNADGSESEMCGNGIRCVCKFAHDGGISTARPMRVQTGAGVLDLEYTLDDDGGVDTVTVDMGTPTLEVAAIPALAAHLAAAPEAGMHRVEAAGATFDVCLVSMGNPHAVIFLEDLGALELDRVGPALEHHDAFPRRINAHFVQVGGRHEVTMRTWERGSGPTLACGTGASAVCVAAVLTGRTARSIRAHLPGGDLDLEWQEASGHVFMTGTATRVFTGVWTGAACTTAAPG